MVPRRSVRCRREHLSEYSTAFVGPIANNPGAARLTKAGITLAAWRYGTGNGWGVTNALLGFSQIGNTLVIAIFTSCGGFNCSDSGYPIDQITYTLVP